MNKSLNILAVLAAAMAHFFVALAAVGIGRAHKSMFAELDVVLPALSRIVIPYIQGIWPLAIGGILGLLTLVGIGYAAVSKERVAYVPVLLAISFVLVIIHLVMVWYGTSLPLFRIIDSLLK
ncbi:hypothetical protein OAM01_02140 [bacterium]|nr:hypothetical protein [bacterium]